MKKVLILLAHPKYEHSAINQVLADSVKDLENVEIRDLYELYPDFNIDVQAEQEALVMADIIIWQHPVYWYSAPPILKQWIDLVLEFGWAYGFMSSRNFIKGKIHLHCGEFGRRKRCLFQRRQTWAYFKGIFPAFLSDSQTLQYDLPSSLSGQWNP